MWRSDHSRYGLDISEDLLSRRVGESDDEIDRYIAKYLLRALKSLEDLTGTELATTYLLESRSVEALDAYGESRDADISESLEICDADILRVALECHLSIIPSIKEIEETRNLISLEDRRCPTTQIDRLSDWASMIVSRSDLVGEVSEVPPDIVSSKAMRHGKFAKMTPLVTKGDMQVVRGDFLHCMFLYVRVYLLFISILSLYMLW